MFYNWILSNVKSEMDGEVSVVQRLVCAETGMTYRISILNGKPIKIELGNYEEILNPEVAESLWRQLAVIMPSRIANQMLQDLGLLTKEEKDG